MCVCLLLCCFSRTRSLSLFSNMAVFIIISHFDKLIFDCNVHSNFYHILNKLASFPLFNDVILIDTDVILDRLENRHLVQKSCLFYLFKDFLSHLNLFDQIPIHLNCSISCRVFFIFNKTNLLSFNIFNFFILHQNLSVGCAKAVDFFARNTRFSFFLS